MKPLQKLSPYKHLLAIYLPGGPEKLERLEKLSIQFLGNWFSQRAMKPTLGCVKQLFPFMISFLWNFHQKEFLHIKMCLTKCSSRSSKPNRDTCAAKEFFLCASALQASFLSVALAIQSFASLQTLMWYSSHGSISPFFDIFFCRAF